jgi:hypothetical protein
VLLASEPDTANPDHDLFVVQFARDPASGSLVLNLQGFSANGTGAAVLYFQDVILPSLSTFTSAYYVGEWTDADGDHAPDVGEITLVTSG